MNMSKFRISFRRLDTGEFVPVYQIAGQPPVEMVYPEGGLQRMIGEDYAERNAGRELVRLLNANPAYAAAPDMLAALKEFIRLYEEDPDDLENMDKAAKVVDAAIAKAEGRS
jgi:hypothetical protein